MNRRAGRRAFVRAAVAGVLSTAVTSRHRARGRGQAGDVHLQDGRRLCDQGQRHPSLDARPPAGRGLDSRRRADHGQSARDRPDAAGPSHRRGLRGRLDRLSAGARDEAAGDPRRRTRRLRLDSLGRAEGVRWRGPIGSPCWAGRPAATWRCAAATWSGRGLRRSCRSGDTATSPATGTAGPTRSIGARPWSPSPRPAPRSGTR